MARLFSLLVLLTLTATLNAAELRGIIVGVTDGDTVTLLDAYKMQHKIRLAGIDAPERSQAFGQSSKYALGQLAFRRNAVVEYTKLDRYGRYVGKLIVDGRDLCLEQLRSGHAWLYDDYADELAPRDRNLYSQAMRDAKVRKAGLWQDPYAKPPWVYRRERRTR